MTRTAIWAMLAALVVTLGACEALKGWSNKPVGQIEWIIG